MRVLVLDGSKPDDRMAERIQAALMKEFTNRDWHFETFLLREQSIGNCAGDFLCWVRTPGVCNTDDDNRIIAAAMMHCELLVFLTPVTFGGYSSELKRAQDHLIQNISPFFTSIQGETHHQKRYQQYPDFLVIGWMDQPDKSSEVIFQYLVGRNALNMYSTTHQTGILYPEQSDVELQNNVRSLLTGIEQERSQVANQLPYYDSESFGQGDIQRVLLLVGSPRGKKSTSQALGNYLCQQLAARGIKTESIHIYPVLGSAARIQALQQALETADLIVLAFPIYVDGMPGSVVRALEKIASHRSGRQTAQGLVAIANCGFPEVAHTQPALAMCAEFARQAGFKWAGGLGLGGGQGTVHGAELRELGGRAIQITRALDLAAESLANGSPITAEATRLLGKPSIPGWMYRMFSGWSWKQQTKSFHTEKKLHNQPYK